MKSINWTKPTDLPSEETPPIDPTQGRTKERREVTDEILRRDDLRDSAEHKVLRNIARTYARYYGPNR